MSKGPQIDPFLFDLFKTELESHSSVLSNGLLQLEQNPAAVLDWNGMMRAAHSIKGAARIVQLDVLVKLAHRLEDYFTDVQNEKLAVQPGHFDTLFQAVDICSAIMPLSASQMAEQLSSRSTEVDRIADILDDFRQGDPVSESSASPLETVEPPAAKTPADKAENPEPPAAAGTVSAQQEDFVRVTSEKLDTLMAIAGELFIESRRLEELYESFRKAKSMVDEAGEELECYRGDSTGADDRKGEGIRSRIFTEREKPLARIYARNLDHLADYSGRFLRLSESLYHQIIQSKMRPFSDGIHGFPRMIRDLAKQMGKQIRFEVEGRETNVDRDILEKLEAPLNHLLRNASDHGIEMPDRRISHGKDPVGTIRLKADHWAGMLRIEVSDDGCGIDPEHLRRRVVQKKLVSESVAQKLTDAELFEFLFLPGFTTAERVTEISGRGVGLDVVMENIRKVGGTVRIESEPGKGTSFRLQLPLTLSVIRTLMVEVAGEPYALPLNRVYRVLKRPVTAVEVLEDRQYLEMDDQNVGLISARQILGQPMPSESDEWLRVLILSHRQTQYGLVVDDILGEQDIVVHSLEKKLGSIPNIYGATLDEDGYPILILDVDDMVREMEALISGKGLNKVFQSYREQQRVMRKRVLVVDDSITVREVERKLLENSGFQVDVAVDGLDGWNSVRSNSYHLVVTDVDMPRMNGIQFVEKIRKDPKLKNLPIIIMSYKDRDEDRMRGLEAGANHYLTKSSFHDDSMIATVIDLIGEA